MTAEAPDETGVADRAVATANNGWGPIPLPTGKKAPPPEGFTGGATELPDYATYYATYDENPNRWGNLGARIPLGVVGIDVDAYDGKHGGDTWAALGGSEFPPTVVLSSRFGPGYDGTSGIRFYRLPEGIDQADLWGAHDGIEILRYSHRYAVAPGSDHPEGGVYRCVDMRSKSFLDVLPPVDDLPELPIELAHRLTNAGAPWGGKATGERAPDTNPMCRRAIQILGKAIASLETSDSRYDLTRNAVWELMRSEDEGHHIGAAVTTLKWAYVSATAADRKKRGMENPVSEYDRMVANAQKKIDADPTDEMFKACCLSDAEEATPPDVVPEDERFDGDEIELSPYEKVVRAKYAELRVLDDARALLATHKAGKAEPLEPLRYPDFANQPDEEEQYRVESLWPAEGRAMLSAAAKSGKTTMVAANLIPSLLDGRQFLGRFTVQPVTGTIVYLNMEVGPRTLRRWMRDAGVPMDERLIVLNLRGKASSLSLGTEMGRERFAATLADLGAEVVILDPLAPLLASLGIDENDNSQVARFFGWWAETLSQAGVVDDLIVHHTGHAGQRSRGASRFNDEPDAVWTLTKSDTGEDEDDLDAMFGAGPTRFLAAYGRDVELPAEGLEYDPQTHGLILSGQAKGKENGKRVERKIIKLMADRMPRTKNAICKEVGGSRENSWAAIDRLLESGELVDSGAKSANKYPLLILGGA